MEEITLKLASDLKNAMKDRNAVATRTIRSLISEIDNAGAIEEIMSDGIRMSGGIAGATEGVGSTDRPRKDLSIDDIKVIILKEINEIEAAISEFKKTGNDTSELKEQIKILTQYVL